MRTLKPLNFQTLNPQFDDETPEGWNQIADSARAKVPGGWLIAIMDTDGNYGGLTFYPDPEHKWDGGSLE